ncbi:MAG: threonine ammonia-lyase [Chloroflexota bacterium]
MDTTQTLTYADVLAARERQLPHVRRTPTEHSPDLSAIVGREVFLKLENVQRTGAFKIRGAISRLLTVCPEDRARGVVTASAGNHGQGVALAAKLLDCPATVVLPTGAPLAKISAIQRHGAEVVLQGAAYDAAHEHAVRLAEERGLAYVHAFHDVAVMAGQGAVALEIFEDVPDLDTLIVPVGGGGLMSGMAVAARAVSPKTRIIGVQAEGSPALAHSFRAGMLGTGEANTIADGIAVKAPSPLTFEIIQRHVDDIVTVSDEAIARTIVLLLERHKLLAEGAGAAALAALLEGAVAHEFAPPGARVCAVISGGNIDPLLLGKVLQHGMASAGRYLALRTWLDDRPGQLQELTQLLAAERINILHVGIHRLGPYTSLGRVGLDLIVETRDRAHADTVLSLIREHGYPAEEALDMVPPDRGERPNGTFA